MNDSPSPLKNILVFASEKVKPAFQILDKNIPVSIHFTDLSFSPLIFLKNIFQITRADMVYFHSPTNLRIILMPIAYLFRKKIILQWIGGDVLTVTCHCREQIYDIGNEKYISVKKVLTTGISGLTRKIINFVIKNTDVFLNYLNFFVTCHIACSPHLVEELKLVNIKAHYVPVLNHITPEILPFPPNFAVLSYIGFQKSSDTKNFYGWATIRRLAKDFPDLKIYLVGRGGRLDNLPPNIEYCGFVEDISLLLKKCKAVLRITYHDGVPRLILEALATGRYVIYTRSFPTTYTITTYEEVKYYMNRIRNCSEPNMDGYNLIRKEYSQKKVSDIFYKIFTKVNNAD